MPVMEWVELIFAVLLGLAFGSFLNVCTVRVPRGQSVVAPSSHCRHCGAGIRPQDNIPILSWLLLRGRCRNCRARISLQYPLVELASALLFAACLLEFGASIRGTGMALFCWLLLGLALIDAEFFLLPDAFTLPGILLGLVYRGLLAPRLWFGVLNALLAAAAVGGVLLLISLVYKLIRRREGMGLGDVKLGAMLGAWLGWQVAGLVLFLAIVAGAIGGIGLIITRHSQARSEPLQLPFGTFLAAAGIFSIFAGAHLLHWYLAFFP